MKRPVGILCIFLCLALLSPAAAGSSGSEFLFSCPSREKDLQPPASPTCAVTRDAQKIRNGDQIRTGTIVRCPTNTYVCIPEGCLLQYNFVSKQAERVIRHGCPPTDPACLCGKICGTCPEHWRQQ